MTTTRLDRPRLARGAFWLGVLAASGLFAPGRLAAQDGKPSGPISIDELHRDIRPRILKLAKLTRRGEAPDAGSLRQELTIREITRQGKELDCVQAKLTREVAEIMVKEYEEGTAPMDRTTLNGEVELAESAVDRPKARDAEIESVLQKMRQFEATRIYELTTIYDLEKKQRAVRLETAKAQIALDQARGKLKSFDEYGKPKRIKELQGEVDKLGVQEAVKKAELEACDDDIKLLKQQVKLAEKASAPDWSPVLAALDEAVGLERSVQALLNDPPPGEPKARAAWDEKLAAQSAKLRAALDDAEQIAADVEFDQLGDRIHKLLAGPDSTMVR